MAVKTREDRRKIIYATISEATGIATSTLTRLATDKAERVALATMDALCTYFRCTPGGLFIHSDKAAP